MEFTVTTTPRSRPVPYRVSCRYIKRVMDLLITLLALPFLLPLMAVIALFVRLDSPGPALFKQKRVGKNGRLFEIYKFRTMHCDLDDSYHRSFMKAFVKGEIGQSSDAKKVYKPFTDAQVTRVGRFLRKTSLDELPQLFNVLRGEMSLIGPRPNVVWEVEAYKRWHMERLSVLPGITGLAQVNGRSSINFDTIVRYDIEYVKRQSVWLDVQILWKTFTSIVEKRGAA